MAESILVSRLQKLNNTEMGGIRQALEEYIANHPNHKQHWVQKVLLEDMIESLFWATDKQ